VLTVGCARDNNIVLPHSESRRHLLNLRYAQGRVWAEDKGSTQQALIEGIPLTGARQLTQGTVLKVGEAHIELTHT
jgi:pSer/pThr/pTyr-binding forkhead associated (FHA) protein